MHEKKRKPTAGQRAVQAARKPCAPPPPLLVSPTPVSRKASTAVTMSAPHLHRAWGSGEASELVPTATCSMTAKLRVHPGCKLHSREIVKQDDGQEGVVQKQEALRMPAGEGGSGAAPQGGAPACAWAAGSSSSSSRTCFP